MTEKQFQTKVIKHLKSLPKTWFFKVWGGGFQRSGIPDIIACVNGVFVAIELKAEVGKATELQMLNVRQINAAGGIAIILYPAGFESFKKIIEEVLKCSSHIAGLSALKSANTNTSCDIKIN